MKQISYERTGESVRFSIVVLAYNLEDYIEQCLDSIRNQTFADYEVWVVNDGSSDRTEEICTRYSQIDNRFHLITHTNRGQLLSRIAGFQKAKGEYYLCIDGDDYWDCNLLSTVDQYLQKKPSELAIYGYRSVADGVINHTVEHLFLDGKVFNVKDKQEILAKLADGGPINEMWVKVISAELFNRITINFESYGYLRKAEDLFYSLFLVQEANTILYIDRVLYNYRTRPGSIINSFRPEELNDMLFVKSYIEHWIETAGIASDMQYRRFYDNVYFYFAHYIYRCGLSEFTNKKKMQILKRVKEEKLFKRSCKGRTAGRIDFKHQLFMWMFFHCIPLFIFLGNAFRICKTFRNQMRRVICRKI